MSFHHPDNGDDSNNVATVDEVAELHQQIATQTEYYFSPENLSRDAFLRSRMNANGYVSVSVLAGFRRLRDLTTDIETLIAAMRVSNILEVMFDQESGEVLVGVIPSARDAPTQRTTLILRDVPVEVTKDEIFALFTNPARPVIAVHAEIGQSWYVSFASEDACKEEFLRLQMGNVKLHDAVVHARIKSESVPGHAKSNGHVPTATATSMLPMESGEEGAGMYPYPFAEAGYPPFAYAGCPPFGYGAMTWTYDDVPMERGRGRGFRRGGHPGRGRRPYGRAGSDPSYPHIVPAPPGHVQKYCRADFLTVFESMRLLHNGNLPICASMTDSSEYPCVLSAPTRDVESLPSVVPPPERFANSERSPPHDGAPRHTYGRGYGRGYRHGPGRYGSDRGEPKQQSSAPPPPAPPEKKLPRGIQFPENQNPTRPSFAQIASKAPPPQDKKVPPRPAPVSTDAKAPAPDETHATPQKKEDRTPPPAPPLHPKVEEEPQHGAPGSATAPLSFLFDFGPTSYANLLKAKRQPAPTASSTAAPQLPTPSVGVIAAAAATTATSTLTAPDSNDEEEDEDLPAEDDNWATHVMGQLRSTTALAK